MEGGNAEVFHSANFHIVIRCGYRNPIPPYLANSSLREQVHRHIDLFEAVERMANLQGRIR